MENKKFRNKTTGEIVTQFNISDTKNFEEVVDTKVEKRKKLFKEIYGSCISSDYDELETEEIVEMLNHIQKLFAKRFIN